VVHESPGRTRLRLSWRPAPDQADALAEALVTLRGMEEVEVRRWTGSILCRYRPGALGRDEILDPVRRFTDVERILKREEAAPRPPAIPRQSTVAHLVRGIARELDQDVLRATDGRLDLGMLVSLAFAGAGALEVATTGRLPVPPWFNLAWWSLRTFVTFESGKGAPDAAPTSNGVPHVVAVPQTD
jgi:hypothetical protein